MRIIYLFIVLVFTFTGFSQTQTYTYNFEVPQLNQNEDGYTKIVYKNCLNFGEEGYPSIPYLGVNVLLPQGKEIKNISVVSISYYSLQENIKIIPASRQFPLSEIIHDYKVIPNEKIYSSLLPYPEKIFDNISTHFLSGHSIGSFTICPANYIPAKDQVEFIKQITIKINSKTTDKALESKKFLKKSMSIKKRINSIVENPGDLKNYIYPIFKNTDEYDILLITNNILLAAFNDYMKFKESTGFAVKTVVTEDIYTQYSGQDNQEKIRNCIIDNYENYGISYVILGGDADAGDSLQNIVPHRGFYALNELDIPADMYYACLDGTWNDDGDNKWGEPGEDDLYAELSIGRICVDNDIEIQNFTNKLFMYQNHPVVEDIEKALMIGEYLWPETYGGTYKDEVALGSSNHGYSTVGVSENITVSRLYEILNSWSKTKVFKQFNNTGVNLLNHLGHSNVNYNMKMNNADITTENFQNDGITRGYAIGYSQGCYNGAFDNRNDGGIYISDCFSEKITTIETAEVACIGNSRYGWGSQGSTNGASQYLDRQFYDAIFGEGFTIIGQANGDSKEDNVEYINASEYIRWSAYELNVFGDPSMDIWTEVPVEITTTYPYELSIETEQVLFLSDAPFSRIGLVQNGELIGRGLANESGNATIDLFSAINTYDPIEVSIIGHNRIRHQGTIDVFSNQASVIYNSHVINDASGNGLVEYGETVNLSLGLQNNGDLSASDIIVTLSTTDPYINITDNTENFGNFIPDEIIFIENAFSFEADNTIPDEHFIIFDLSATDGNNSWVSHFIIKAYAPNLQFVDFVIFDPTGNNNGRIDPGETANITITIENTGSCNALNVYGELFSDYSFITINQVALPYGNIPINESLEQNFSITADINTPEGIPANFDFEMTADTDITAIDTFYTIIGRYMTLVVDLDKNKYSGPEIYSTFENMEITAAYITEFPEDLINTCKSLFLCLGIHFTNYVLSEDEGQMLADFLNYGGNIYLEGRITWLDDPQTVAHPMFSLNAVEDTWFQYIDILGMEGAFTNEMNFIYNGEKPYNNYYLEPVAPAFCIFQTQSPEYSCAVAYDAENYKTIGTTFEFGKLEDGSSPSTKAELMQYYLNFFDGLMTSEKNPDNSIPESARLFNNYPNPFIDNTTIQFALNQDTKVNLEILNINGQKVKTLKDQKLKSGNYNISWDGTDNYNNTVAPGIYLLKMQTDEFLSVKRIIVIDE